MKPNPGRSLQWKRKHPREISVLEDDTNPMVSFAPLEIETNSMVRYVQEYVEVRKVDIGFTKT